MLVLLQKLDRIAIGSTRETDITVALREDLERAFVPVAVKRAEALVGCPSLAKRVEVANHIHDTRGLFDAIQG